LTFGHPREQEPVNRAKVHKVLVKDMARAQLAEVVVEIRAARPAGEIAIVERVAWPTQSSGG